MAWRAGDGAVQLEALHCIVTSDWARHSPAASGLPYNKAGIEWHDVVLTGDSDTAACV